MAMSYNSSKIETNGNKWGKIPQGSFLFLITIMQFVPLVENREILTYLDWIWHLPKQSQVEQGSVDYLHLPVLFVDFIRELLRRSVIIVTLACSYKWVYACILPKDHCSCLRVVG